MNKYKSLDVLNCASSACIITHLKPDADALASSLILAKFLKEQFNLAVDIFTEFSTLPEKYISLIGKTKLNPKPKKYNTAIMIDSPNSLRLGKFANLFEGAKQKIVIDHHASNNYSGDINIVELISSTCEIIYKILETYNYPLTKDICELLYSGVITDTNNFTVGNFNFKTFKMIAEISKQIDPKIIYKTQFSNDINNMRVLAKAIENIEFFENERIIFSTISKSEAAKMNLEEQNFEGIINRLATIGKNEFVCFIYPRNNGYYCSLRAKEPFSVVEIAVKHGGGGHTGAAAFISNKSISTVKKAVLKEFVRQLKN